MFPYFGEYPIKGGQWWRSPLIRLTPFIPLLFLLVLSVDAQNDPLSPRIGSFYATDYKAHNQIFCVERDKAGGMWFGSTWNYPYYTGEGWELNHTQPGMAGFAMDIDDHGRIWLGGQGDLGYFRIIQPPSNEPRDSSTVFGKRERRGDPGDMQFVSLVRELPDSLREFNAIRRVHAMEDHVVFNTQDDWVFLLDSNGFQVIKARSEFFRSFKVDGEIWVQDKEKGVYRFSKDFHTTENHHLPRSNFLRGTEIFTDKNTVSIIDSVAGITKGNEKLIATYLGKLYRYLPPDVDDKNDSPLQRGEVKRFIPEDPSLEKKVRIFKATPLIRTGNKPAGSRGNAVLLLSTINHGEVLIDSLGRPVQTLDRKKGMPSNMIWDNAIDPNGSGQVWSATNNGIGYWSAIDPRTYSNEGKGFLGSIKDIITWRDRVLFSTSQGVFARNAPSGFAPLKKGKAKDWVKIPGIDNSVKELLAPKMAGPGVVVAEKNLMNIHRTNGEWKVDTISKQNGYTLDAPSAQREGKFLAVSGGQTGIRILEWSKGSGWDLLLNIDDPPEYIRSVIATYSNKRGVIKDLGSNEKILKEDLMIWTGFPSKLPFLISIKMEDLVEWDEKDVRWDRIRKGKVEGIKVEPLDGQGNITSEIKFNRLSGRVVIGTNKGLYRPIEGGMSPDTTFGCYFTKCPDHKGTTRQKIFRLNENDSGNVWIMSVKDVHRLIKKEDGSYEHDCIPLRGMDIGIVRAFHTDEDGVTWVGGDKGLTRFDPKVEKNFTRPYSTSIRKVKVKIPGKREGEGQGLDSVLFSGFYRVPLPDDPLLPWKRVYSQPDSYKPVLPYSLNGITFHFSSAFYEKQEDVLYKYKLEGFNKRWSKWKKETKKEYTNLPEGEYTFKVKALNVYDQESRTAAYSFTILPPWYRTWTAYGGYTIGGIGFIWLLLWLNGRRLVAQKQRLEKIVDERTKDIQREKSKVEKKNKELEEANKTISDQKEEVELFNKEISESIDYASKIQQALLRTKEDLSAHGPGHFILFKPQARVSGDFYWAKEHKGYLYMAAVDCTGHGVPGAFMSMLGISQLNEIMNTSGTPLPGEILEKLRERVVRELSGDDPEDAAKDGMDAAMVRIPLHEEQTSQSKGSGKRIQFAGANNPLYIVKEGVADQSLNEVRMFQNGQAVSVLEERIKPFKKTQDGLEIKPDKMAIGYDPHAREAFRTMEVEVPEGSMLYLFSDGYADQFGGPKGKKFRYGPFKKLLAEIHERSPEEQKSTLDRRFEEWKGGREQIDDVVVVGIRVPS